MRAQSDQDGEKPWKELDSQPRTTRPSEPTVIDTCAAYQGTVRACTLVHHHLANTDQVLGTNKAITSHRHSIVIPITIITKLPSTVVCYRPQWFSTVEPPPQNQTTQFALHTPGLVTTGTSLSLGTRLSQTMHSSPEVSEGFREKDRSTYRIGN